ncbi:hypothetical protein PMO31116_04455 [Pandoraea morbifera]|uniref:Glycosyl transferase family 1 domain-containing protein n=1 Tax=Pandoraea morbifera TaxID=2508300 RepID=A0A5E4YFU8_9BURK|nr:glycosyltransferase [Pandoraea morbifera]VVE47686.1 hypothetical protein PMO31116_04455 [Pandoraea morbifera]
MLVLNFYNLNKTNGMYYYGLDYAEPCADRVGRILVRPQLVSAARAAFPNVDVRSCGALGMAWEVVKAGLRGDFVFTPTPHPIPFVRNQLVIFHDIYPFVGRLGNLKRNLFTIGTRTSGCLAGYTNLTAKPFLDSVGIAPSKQVFAPSRFPAERPRLSAPEVPDGGVIVGLMGTDSDKKNYAALFSSIQRLGIQRRIIFHVFGHDTEYYRSLQTAFPDIEMILMPSDKTSMDQFVGGVSVVVSATDGEGFGRPIAHALACGVPCLLLDCAVFREFFDGMADFAPDVDGIAKRLGNEAFAREPARPFAPPARVVDGIESTVALLKSLS